MTINAGFAELPVATDVSYGKKCVLQASAAELANFASMPSVYSLYIDPVKSGTAQKAPLKVLDKIAQGIAPIFVNCQWTKCVFLFDKTLWDKTLTCKQNFAAHGNIEPLPTNLRATGKDAAGKIVKDQDTHIALNLVPPEITGVYDANDGKVISATAGQTLTIQGLFFGTTQPTAWLEYPAYDGQGRSRR
jgi:hypothetical protein